MRVYSREFRIEVVRRILNGEKVPALSKELGIHRKLLYDWMRYVNAGGESNLRERGRPKKSDAAVAPDVPDRIARLERELARQQRIIEFLQTALQRTRSGTRGQKIEWRAAIFRTIEEMHRPGLSAEAMCRSARIGRGAYYRYLRSKRTEQLPPTR